MTGMKYPKLFGPGRIGNLTTRNRIVMPPMATNFAGPWGEPTERLIKYYAERAKGGAGLIITRMCRSSIPKEKTWPASSVLMGTSTFPDTRSLPKPYMPGERWFLCKSTMRGGNTMT